MARHLTNVDLTGQRRGMLVAIRYSHRTANGHYWIWRCDCGNEKPIRAADVLREKQTSCGCVHVTHGATRGGKLSPEYMSWYGMRQRCLNPNATGYENYGGRGIKVCDRWRESFESFFADVGPRPSPDHSIDRIDSDGHYEPENVRWATRTEQNRNKRGLHMLTVDGETMCLRDWARRTNIDETTLARRVGKLGWSHERAVKTPVGSVKGKGRPRKVRPSRGDDTTAPT